MHQKIIKHFEVNDPHFHKTVIKVLEVHKEITVVARSPKNYFEDLCGSIINQQLSSRAGETIFRRFKSLFKRGEITPKAILKIKDEKIRACGLSNAKVKYIKDLAGKIISGEVDLEQLNSLSDEEVIEELTKVKGIGKWTAEMFLMFCLGREDIFSQGDLGLVNAIKKIYNLANPTKTEIERVIEKWSPYKTYASRILWKSLEL